MEGGLLHSFVGRCFDRAELGSFAAGISGDVCRGHRAFWIGPTVAKLAAKTQARSCSQIMDASIKEPPATRIGEVEV